MSTSSREPPVTTSLGFTMTSSPPAGAGLCLARPAPTLTAAQADLGHHCTGTCADAVDELGAQPSFLNPLWYAGGFGLGLLAGWLGDPVSLGFVLETENQVEAHLQSHLSLLPANDHASRAIVAQMKEDEARHALNAQKAGATELPQAVKSLMRAAAKVMTTVAHRV